MFKNLEPLAQLYLTGRIVRIIGWIAGILAGYDVELVTTDGYQHLANAIVLALFSVALGIIHWFLSELSNLHLFNIGKAVQAGVVVPAPKNIGAPGPIAKAVSTIILIGFLFISASSMTACNDSQIAAMKADASAVGATVLKYTSDPLLDQGAGFLAGGAIIKYANKNNPKGTALDVYTIATVYLKLDSGGTVNGDDAASLLAAFKTTGNTDSYEKMGSEALNLINAKIQSLKSQGATTAQITTAVANFITGIQQAGAVNS